MANFVRPSFVKLINWLSSFFIMSSMSSKFLNFLLVAFMSASFTFYEFQLSVRLAVQVPCILDYKLGRVQIQYCFPAEHL